MQIPIQRVQVVPETGSLRVYECFECGVKETVFRNRIID